MRKNDAINIMKNSNFHEKIDYSNFFLLYIKMSEENYYQNHVRCDTQKSKGLL